MSDNTTKTVSYEIPSNFTTVDGAGSNCNAHENILKVSWMEGNTFEIKFQHSSNESAYDLTSIIVSLNTSSIFNDSQGMNTSTYQYECFIDQHVISVYLSKSNCSSFIL